MRSRFAREKGPEVEIITKIRSCRVAGGRSARCKRKVPEFNEVLHSRKRRKNKKKHVQNKEDSQTSSGKTETDDEKGTRNGKV